LKKEMADAGCARNARPNSEGAALTTKIGSREVAGVARKRVVDVDGLQQVVGRLADDRVPAGVCKNDREGE
jgi:hypothetical protein